MKLSLENNVWKISISDGEDGFAILGQFDMNNVAAGSKAERWVKAACASAYVSLCRSTRRAPDVFAADPNERDDMRILVSLKIENPGFPL